MVADTEENEEGGCAKRGCSGLFSGVYILLAALIMMVVMTEASGRNRFIANLVFAGYLLWVGGRVGSWFPDTLGTNAKRRLSMGGVILCVLGLACLLTPLGVTIRSSPIDFDAEVPAQGGIAGPIEVPHDIKRVDVEIDQGIAHGEGKAFQRWSYVTVELLDESKNYLAGFGGELWREAGSDDGYHWEEADEEYDVTLRFPSPGTYFVRVNTESNVSTPQIGPVKISMNGTAPDHLWPLRVASLFIFFFGGGFLWAGDFGN